MASIAAVRVASFVAKETLKNGESPYALPVIVATRACSSRYSTNASSLSMIWPDGGADRSLRNSR